MADAEEELRAQEAELERLGNIIDEMEGRIDELEGELRTAKDEAEKYRNALEYIASEANASLK